MLSMYMYEQPFQMQLTRWEVRVNVWKKNVDVCTPVHKTFIWTKVEEVYMTDIYLDYC